MSRRIREVRQLGPGHGAGASGRGTGRSGHVGPESRGQRDSEPVLTERDGALWIALLQNTPAAFHGRPDASEALTRELTEVLRAGRVVQA